MPETSGRNAAAALSVEGPTRAGASSGSFSLVGFGVGDFAVNLGMSLAAIYLLYYFTDVFAIGAAAAGSILLFGRLGLSFFDPFIGIWSDRTRTRWGSRRPFLLFGALPLVFFTFALFASPDIPAPWRTLYALVAFSLFFMNLSVINVPYTSLMAVLTRDSRERSRVAGVKLVFAICGTLLAAAGTLPLVGLFKSEIIGFRYVGLGYGMVAAVAIWITFLSVREPESVSESESFTARQSIGLAVSNRPFLILASATVLFQVAMNMMGAIASYYFKYVLGAEYLIPIAFVCLFVTAILCTPFFVRLSNRTSKMSAYSIGMGTMAVTLTIVYFMGRADIAIILFTFILSGAGISVMYLSPWAMIPDTVEYSEWKTGRRMEGVMFGMFFFCWKLAAAASGLITGLGLELIGYVPNVEQSAGAIRGLTAMLTIIPAGCIVVGILILRFYPINEALFEKMVEDIDNRNNG